MDVPGKSPATLFLFIDESGNFDFSERGTRFFVMAGIATLAPGNSAADVQNLKYSALADRYDISSFHASEDRQVLRNKMFEVIGSQQLMKVHAVFGDKNRAPEYGKTDSSFIANFGEELVRQLLSKYSDDEFNQTILLFDQSLPRKKRDVFYSTIKPTLKALRKPFHIYFHSMSSDLNGQVADYISWARYISLEREEMRPWNLIQATLSATSSNLFEN